MAKGKVTKRTEESQEIKSETKPPRITRQKIKSEAAEDEVKPERTTKRVSGPRKKTESESAEHLPKKQRAITKAQRTKSGKLRAKPYAVANAKIQRISRDTHSVFKMAPVKELIKSKLRELNNGTEPPVSDSAREAIQLHAEAEILEILNASRSVSFLYGRKGIRPDLLVTMHQHMS